MITTRIYSKIFIERLNKILETLNTTSGIEIIPFNMGSYKHHERYTKKTNKKDTRIIDIFN
jgi:hypothetical protein